MTLCIVDAGKDVGMKKLNSEEAMKILDDIMPSEDGDEKNTDAVKVDGVKELTERMKALAENVGHALGIMSKQVDDLTQKVELLSDLPSAQPEHLVKESSDLVKDLVNDCISRQSALDILDDFQSNIELGIDDYEEKRKALCDLPSADRPKGEWIDMGDFEQCSVCEGTHLKEFETRYGKALWVKSKYCQNCGADMRGGTE